jgi:hypothetical protein
MNLPHRAVFLNVSGNTMYEYFLVFGRSVVSCIWWSWRINGVSTLLIVLTNKIKKFQTHMKINYEYSISSCKRLSCF